MGTPRHVCASTGDERTEAHCGTAAPRSCRANLPHAYALALGNVSARHSCRSNMRERALPAPACQL
jgi:hypothetical protein